MNPLTIFAAYYCFGILFVTWTIRQEQNWPKIQNEMDRPLYEAKPWLRPFVLCIGIALMATAWPLMIKDAVKK